MKTNGTTLMSRNTNVMAGIDKRITTSITIDRTAFTQADCAAHHTMGSVRKKGVTGNVVGVNVTRP